MQNRSIFRVGGIWEQSRPLLQLYLFIGSPFFGVSVTNLNWNAHDFWECGVCGIIKGQRLQCSELYLGLIRLCRRRFH